MAPIRESVEIARSPEELFAYLDDFPRHTEWQESLVSARVETEGPMQAGSRVTETRRMGKREQTATFEMTDYDPPRSASFRGTDGPIRSVGRRIVEPLGDGSRSRFTLELDFTGRGIGKLLVPLARNQARKQVPRSMQRLKEHLEGPA
jgi:hypothetical protein